MFDLDAATIAEMQQSVKDATAAALSIWGQSVAAYRPATPSGGQAGPPEVLDAALTVAIKMPSSPAQIQLLERLGSGRASALGYAEYGADVLPGDEWYASGSIAYQVINVSYQVSGLICALSKRTNATAPTTTTSPTVVGAWIGIGRIPTYSEAL